MAERPAVTLAAFGLASGILSATLGFMFEPPWLEPVAALFWLEPGMMPIGLFYGVALGLGLMLCTGRQLAAPHIDVRRTGAGCHAWSIRNANAHEPRDTHTDSVARCGNGHHRRGRRRALPDH